MLTKHYRVVRHLGWTPWALKLSYSNLLCRNTKYYIIAVKLSRKKVGHKKSSLDYIYLVIFSEASQQLYKDLLPWWWNW